jgi:4-hydroxybenzoate polyprenyltransferase
MAETIKADADIPLVVDLDGTLTKTDTLHEALVQLVSQKPMRALRTLPILMHGRAVFKAAISNHILPDMETIPVNLAVLEAISQARREGRKVYLATAADQRFAVAAAASIGQFDGVFASADGINLKGQAKADSLVAAFGTHGFDYIGNDAADLPVWRVARKALVSSARSRLMRRLSSELPTAIALDTRELAIGPYLMALRPHQWLKNGLIALPAIAAHDFGISSFVKVLIAFASFSFGASSMYIVNDMLDLPHDRVHSNKRFRSIAAGTVPLTHGLFLFGIAVALSVVLALMLPLAFLAILIAYFCLTMSYSFWLKHKLMIDVVALAMLYGIRVLAGGVASGIALSHWLIGFCFFIFLSLALVKRTAELISLTATGIGNIKGRGYRSADRETIVALAAASGFVAVLVLALYISSPEIVTLYRTPQLLWGICIILVYWLGRVYCLAGRGEMNQDPVIFAATDRISLLAGIVILGMFLVAL